MTITIDELANQLTPEQFSELLNIAYGPLPENIKEMSDDELLQELTA